ncbi:MAG TPA: endonuclease MutS2 [Syntrophomonadaceae bacterium]|nr:endonuclease MutS2 [Syntrophomonadaceae bacterium]
MDEKILNKLEYNKIRDQLASLCSSVGGRTQALAMEPQYNMDHLQQLLDETEEAMEALRFQEPGFLSDLQLIKAFLDKARVGGLLMPGELREIYLVARASSLAIKYLAPTSRPRLAAIGRLIHPLQPLEKSIDQAISEEGTVRDEASEKLRSTRKQINTLRGRIKDYLQDFIRSTSNQKMLQDILVTERDGRYVVPVKQEYRTEVKGIIHDESASGATVFIEPLPVVEHNNRIRSLQMEEKREIERILRLLSQKVAVMEEELAENQEQLSGLDLIFARARLAYKSDAFRPQLNNQGIVDLSRARHPLLGEGAVPIDVHLGDKFDILVITGPNTGGKTVVLKTIGLLTLMAMSGLFVPARENSRVSVFDHIFVDIGDEQSIEQSLSTFSSHMGNIIEILRQANNRSLVLLDELGAGTDPAEGAALARAILEDLINKKSRVVITTHQSELKNFAFQHQRAENSCVEFDPRTLQPTYKLTIGMPGQSNALVIARRLGLDPTLVNHARELLPRNEQEIGQMIRQLQESRQQFEQSNRDMENLKADILKQKQELEEARHRFQTEREEILSKTREEARSYLRGIKAEADEAIRDMKEVLKNREALPKWHEIELSRQKLKNLSAEDLSDPVIWKGTGKFKPGDYVLIGNIHQKGYVLTVPDSQGEVSVQVGNMRLNVQSKNLQSCKPGPEVVTYNHAPSFLEKAQKISREIDVRGKLAEEALLEVDRYLEDANLVGLTSVRIIHGKGTGALRKAIRSYLSDHNYVKEFRDGFREEGGHGVTVVELR